MGIAIGKIALIALSLLMLGASDRERRLTRRSLQEAVHSPETRTHLRRLRQSWVYWLAVRLWVMASALFAVAIGVVELWGPFWPIAPKLNPAGDDFSLPFTVTNTSQWYSLRVLQVRCSLGGTDPADPSKKASYNTTIVNLDVPVVLPGRPINFSCEGTYFPGFRVNSAEMWVGVAYQVEAGQYKVQKPKIISGLFKYQHGKWVEGPIY